MSWSRREDNEDRGSQGAAQPRWSVALESQEEELAGNFRDVFFVNLLYHLFSLR